jgi:hypothetical protein
MELEAREKRDVREWTDEELLAVLNEGCVPQQSTPE